MWLAAHILIGLAFGYCATSVIEWYIHRYHMHRHGWMNRFHENLFFNHQITHHRAYRADFRRSDPPNHVDIGVPSSVGATLKMALPLAALIALVAPVEAVAFIAVSIFHALAWSAFHREMHAPRGRWFAGTAWFRACCRHHEIHHRHPKANLNGLFLGADWVFGTRYRPTGPAARS